MAVLDRIRRREFVVCNTNHLYAFMFFELFSGIRPNSVKEIKAILFPLQEGISLRVAAAVCSTASVFLGAIIN